jgi:hypothetical protein
MGQGKNSMSTQEKLQRAIQATIAAGYQLNSEAFEFLSQNCETNDPLTIMKLALERIQEIQDKPMFIERGFLEALIQQPTVPTPQIQPPESQITSEQQIAIEPPIIPEINAEETEFYPYAKYIPADINILEDATGKLSSNGTLDEYLVYFQDRFKRIERLLRQRMDVKAATSILEALKSPAKTNRKEGFKKPHCTHRRRPPRQRNRSCSPKSTRRSQKESPYAFARSSNLPSCD